MLISKLYQQFLKHTELVDSTYKSVFVQISSILERIDIIQFKSLEYNVGNEKVLLDFTSLNDVPNYVVEIVRNLFEQFYTLPQTSTVQLTVQYGEDELKVIAQGDVFTIPEDLLFIRQYALCPYFINNHIVYEPFEDFERYFKFIYLMCKEKEVPIQELQELFRDAGISKDTAFALEAQSTDDINSVLISLKKSRKESIDKLAGIKADRESLFSKKLGSTQKVAERNALLDNRLRVSSDHTDMQREKDTHYSRIQQTQNLLKQVEQELLSINQDSNFEDFNYLKDKKCSLTQALDAMQDNYKQISNIESTYASQIKTIDMNLTEFTAYNDINIGQLDDTLSKYDESIVYLEGLISNFESKIHELYTQLNTTIKPTNTSIASTDIVVHKLSNIGYSRPIIVVVNYIKNIFTYNVLATTNMLVQSSEFKHYGDNETVYAQTTATRLVLSDLLNLSFTNTFSSLPINHKSYNHVVNIREDR